MINKASFIHTEETYPYRNLAMEEYLMQNCAEEECILYLWQNRNTVVIGKNQNCWRECRVSELERDGGYLVRRLSGGGAVYHDMGNLNFTFLVRKANYDIDKQMSVIIKAMQLLGIRAEKSGRNDAIADGRKFSGNAFYERGVFCYHHGTLLLNVDTEKMSRYLDVSSDKLKSKGVDSVHSRVVNLCELCPGITVKLVSEKMREALGMVYEIQTEDFDISRFDDAALKESEEKFASWEWKFGRKIPFSHEFGTRFKWGDVQVQLQVNGGIIENANVFSDSMDESWPEELAAALKGCLYEKRAMCEIIEKAVPDVSDDLKKLTSEFI